MERTTLALLSALQSQEVAAPVAHHHDRQGLCQREVGLHDLATSETVAGGPLRVRAAAAVVCRVDETRLPRSAGDWCGRGDLTPTGHWPTSPSSWRVCRSATSAFQGGRPKPGRPGEATAGLRSSPTPRRRPRTRRPSAPARARWSPAPRLPPVSPPARRGRRVPIPARWPMIASSSAPAMNSVPSTVVTRVSNEAPARAPNAAWVPPPPNAAAISPPLPCCSSTTTISSRQAST